jgi:transcriptional regulator with XRE-family HTH domain
MDYSGEVIKAARKRAMMKQCELATRVGVSPAYISMIESGGKTPSPDTLIDIAKALGLPSGEVNRGALPDNVKFFDNFSFITALLVELKQDAEHQRVMRLKSESRNIELSRSYEHAAGLVLLLYRHREINFDSCAAEDEKNRRFAELAIQAAHDGVPFGDLKKVFLMKDAELAKHLKDGARRYECECAGGGWILATNPNEAGLRLRCAECAKREDGGCRGYGWEQPSESLVEFIERLKANGVLSGAEHAAYVKESYGIDLNLSQISSIMHDYHKGRKIPDYAQYCDPLSVKRGKRT